MSEEKHSLQRKADRAKPGSTRSVLSYMTILFAAAFILLLMAYFMQQRSSEATIDGLKDSVSAIQNAQEVYEENAKLKSQLNDLEEDLQAAEDRLSALEGENALLQGQFDSLLSTHEATAQAMDWFWQIDEAYVRGRYSLCRQLIESISEAGLVQLLPTESFTDNGRFSPYERYQEIYDALY